MKITGTFVALVTIAQSAAAFAFEATEANTFAPAPFGRLLCDPATSKCIANLDYGNSIWVAQWDAVVYQNGLSSSPDYHKATATMSLGPVPVSRLLCDPETRKCTANLNYGDGSWVAQWTVTAIRTAGIGHSLAPIRPMNMLCDTDSYRCTADLYSGNKQWAIEWRSTVFHMGSLLDQN